MGSTEKFCLKWNDFHVNIGAAFQEIRHEREFFDVTLASEDEQIQAHKVILSACSPFFRGVLRKNKHEHPLLYLKGVKFTELLSILNFMYNGEVNVAQDELSSFLAVAEELKIKGLSQTVDQSENKVDQGRTKDTSPRSQGYSGPRTSSSYPTPRSNYGSPSPAKRPRTNQTKPTHSASSTPKSIYKDECLVPVKNEPGTPVDRNSSPEDQSGEDVPNENRALSVNNTQQDPGYLEEFPVEDYEGMDGLEESDIQGPGYTCPICNVLVPSYQALHKHISRNHNTKKKNDVVHSSVNSCLIPVDYLDYPL
ncbi:broad-complex core protein isoforms 1/2/3/4/5 [Eurytemora carolleeae]|uniref:broad-complex core protein isoforms 1/2/3/4/5 n=1 Tax=Eurytemora carolleeae TaxID=1294199 RepID=UPI000C75FF55|nr:broad-complex core protein isoforms 1/2/3/4/5 [Eurytemora carolleeae]|eukprot:XP_023331901.1 broad-complex core protein isoforms 1/2/3/4/5-like [Eurytemora affinis]